MKRQVKQQQALDKKEPVQQHQLFKCRLDRERLEVIKSGPVHQEWIDVVDLEESKYQLVERTKLEHHPEIIAKFKFFKHRQLLANKALS
jgi:hypothetical protein